MQRIIAGSLRGRSLLSFPGKEIRPTSSRVREAIFNIVMHRYTEDGEPYIAGQMVADICCGSGAMGLEAISRGAESCIFVDIAHSSLELVRKNAQKLGVLDQCDFLLADSRALPAPPHPCRTILIDPPYKKELLPPILASLAMKKWCMEEALILVEQAKTEPAPANESFMEVETRIYGGSRVTLLTPA